MKIVITGAASGIGREAFTQRPHDGTAPHLLMADREGSAIEEAAAEMRGLGATVATFMGDLADPDVPARMIAAAEAAFGGIDALISNAGTIHSSPIAQLSLAEYERMFAINTRAGLLLAQAAYPMLKASRGAVVATGSIAATHPSMPLGAYAASKAALLMLMRQLALEWGPDGIRCNCVSPGPTVTGMTAGAYADAEMRRRRASEIPLRRIGEAADIANAIHFLVGPYAAFISGVDLLVDGGLNTTLMVSGNSAAQRI
jgi:NAD(P)-dependent dehydrogenase (short-subunit alcohol dehydrogenase family)